MKVLEQPRHQTGMAPQPALGVLAVGRDVQRVVAHPASEDADGRIDLVCSQVSDLDRVLLRHREAA
jgi:hypothetical protein